VQPETKYARLGVDRIAYQILGQAPNTSSSRASAGDPGSCVDIRLLSRSPLPPSRWSGAPTAHDVRSRLVAVRPPCRRRSLGLPAPVCRGGCCRGFSRQQPGVRTHPAGTPWEVGGCLRAAGTGYPPAWSSERERRNRRWKSSGTCSFSLLWWLSGSWCSACWPTPTEPAAVASPGRERMILRLGG
jgi:hypothetical protein